MIARYPLAGLLLIVSQSAFAQSDGGMTACVDRANGATDAMLDCGKTEIGIVNAIYPPAIAIARHTKITDLA